MKKLLIWLICCGLFSLATAQNPNAREELALQAGRLFHAGQYQTALPLYLELLQTENDNLIYQYRTGICYLNSATEKGKAAKYLSTVANRQPTDSEVYLQAGMACQYNYQFEDAITWYLHYLKESVPTEETTELIKRKIETCENGRELIKFPVDVTFENLGNAVNSPFNDYFPLLPADESFVIFNSNRKAPGLTDKTDGNYSSDVYIAYVRNGKFQPARLLSKGINTPDENEEIVGLSGNGEIALFTMQTGSVQKTVFIGTIRGDKADSIIALPENINAPLSVESAATISPDGRSIYFSSNRAGGFGGLDLYVSRLLPTGEWSQAENLGPNINTPYDENYANLSQNGNQLYFSSEGHTSMGGLDIFVSTFVADSGTWGRTKNIGAPLNTPDDDFNLTVTNDGRNGYMATRRPDRQGGLDIYRLTFNEVLPSFTVIRGNIYSTSMQKIKSGVSISIDDLNGERYGDYLPNPLTGRYIIILPPGKYFMIATSDKGEVFREQLIVFDKGSFLPEIEKNIIVK